MRESLFKAVIFDMDGVLVDSEIVYEEVIDQIMKDFGKEVPKELLSLFHGIPSEDAWQVLKLLFSPSASASELLAMEKQAVDDCIRQGKIRPVPFAFEFVRRLKEEGLKVAIATSNFAYRAKMFLEQNSAEALVDVLITGDDVVNNKPAPDVFLLAAERLGICPEECLVVEDALAGVNAAKAAGMKVALYSNPEREQFTDCDVDFVLNTFESITFEFFTQRNHACEK